jgi:hypothetical protein
MNGHASDLIVDFSYFASAAKNTLRKIFETNSKEVTDDENCVMGYVIICTLKDII